MKSGLKGANHKLRLTYSFTSIHASRELCVLIWPMLYILHAAADVHLCNLHIHAVYPLFGCYHSICTSCGFQLSDKIRCYLRLSSTLEILYAVNRPAAGWALRRVDYLELKSTQISQAVCMIFFCRWTTLSHIRLPSVLSYPSETCKAL